MKLKKYITEAKVIDFDKKKNEQILQKLKDYHDDLSDMFEDIRKTVNKDDEAASILMLLKSARQQLKKYIDKRE